MNTRKLLRAAWLELKVTKQMHGSVDGALAQEERYPGWFRSYECGYGVAQEPRLEDTLKNLTETNKKNLRTLAERNGEFLPKKKRTSLQEYRQKLKKLAKRAGIAYQNGQLVRV